MSNIVFQCDYVTYTHTLMSTLYRSSYTPAPPPHLTYREGGAGSRGARKYFDTPPYCIIPYSSLACDSCMQASDKGEKNTAMYFIPITCKLQGIVT